MKQANMYIFSLICAPFSNVLYEYRHLKRVFSIRQPKQAICTILLRTHSKLRHFLGKFNVCDRFRHSKMKAHFSVCRLTNQSGDEKSVSFSTQLESHSLIAATYSTLIRMNKIPWNYSIKVPPQLILSHWYAWWVIIVFFILVAAIWAKCIKRSWWRKMSKTHWEKRTTTPMHKYE